MSSSSSGLSGYYQVASPIAQKSIAAGSIVSSYALVGSTFGYPLLSLILTSTLNGAVQLSLDGTTDWMVLPALGTFVFDSKTNDIVLAAWRGIYVKDLDNPTTGSLYVSGFTVGV